MSTTPDTSGHPKKARFLAELLNGYTVVDACSRAEVGRATVYDWRRDDEQFAIAWREAYEHGTDTLEAEAHRRAVIGIEKPVTVAGQRELVREYSDTLLIFLLKARRPATYRDNHHLEVSGSVDVDSPDLAAAIDRFTSLADAAVRAAARTRARTALTDAAGAGESDAGLPVARLDRET